MRLSAHGITTDLPPGWEGRITKRKSPRDGSSNACATAHPVAHLANFALPESRGDFGSGAVELMSSGHVFVTLFEYGPESVGRALFEAEGIPLLAPRMFAPAALQKTISGQAGCQRFFTQAGRAFCLYVVLGRHDEAAALAAEANGALRSTRIAGR